MKKINIFLSFVIIPVITLTQTSNFAQGNQFQQFIFYVNSLPDPTSKSAAIDSFMNYARTQGIPFITGDSANFIYRGNANSMSVAGDFNFWSQGTSMIKLNQTNFWYYSEMFESDARLDYKFIRNGSEWILDPENPHTVFGGFGPNSELAMPDYIQPWEVNYNSFIQHGAVITRNIYSINVGSTYQLKIYLPPGYDSLSSENYPSVYFQDGFEYVSLGSAVNVIDNLIDSNLIAPVIAVFVKPNDRNVEYAGSKRNQYRLFFVNELVPYIDSNFKTAAIPANRLVLGDSYGGNISALISYNHPEVFALCGLHSGAFQPNSYEIYNKVMTDLANGIVKDIKWSSIWGTYEGSLTGTMSSFRDSLIAHGYSVDWEERHEGHSWGLWRATIDKMLIYFFPDSATSVDDEEFAFPNEFILEQNYPNPFNPYTRINYSIPQNSFISLKVYDVLGNEVANLVDAQQSAGRYEVIFDGSNLASGIYLYTLKAGNFTSTKKLVLMK